jgi:hypothetical protein
MRTLIPESMSFSPIRGNRWSATVQTPAGPLTAVGGSMGEARIALDQLIVILRALNVTHAKIDVDAAPADARRAHAEPSSSCTRSSARRSPTIRSTAS